MANNIPLRLAIAQINSTVGDLEANADKISLYVRKAKEKAADIVCFPELALCGYPPEDLLLKPKFIRDNHSILKKLVKNVDSSLTAVIGFAEGSRDKIYNSAAVINGGRIRGIYRKIFLPNYGVFDEKRYFSSGDKALTFALGNCVFGVNICEDIWEMRGPTSQVAAAGAKLILNINASPFYAAKWKKRQEVIAEQAKTNGVFVVYANLVGGQDELVFDGQSMVVDNKGKVLARAKAFAEDFVVMDLNIPASRKSKNRKIIRLAGSPGAPKNKLEPVAKAQALDPAAEVYQALVLGLKDYVNKNGFGKIVLGLSGGIDSSLVVSLAVDALGNQNVTGVFMPSRYSSTASQEDAAMLAKNLGINFTTISIEQIYRFYLLVLEPHFAGTEKNIAEENLQARIRGNILMAFSNKFGWLVLTTGNKSEMSMGYATLYGDMCGGLAVIKDVPKTMVYKLARYRNALCPVIPERVFTKAPTAELKPNQTDQDTLPPYEVLDGILKAYVEKDNDITQIIASGFEPEIVRKTTNIVDKNEYKRRQSPPGIKITPKAFGRDRRMPITNGYRG